jgi:FtsH-binding integral membrane protein
MTRIRGFIMHLHRVHRRNRTSCALAAIALVAALGLLAVDATGGEFLSGSRGWWTAFSLHFVAFVAALISGLFQVPRLKYSPKDGAASECRGCGHPRHVPDDRCPECGVHPRRLIRHLSRRAATRRFRGYIASSSLMFFFPLEIALGSTGILIMAAFVATLVLVTGLRTNAYLTRLFQVSARSRPRRPEPTPASTPASTPAPTD